MILPRGLPRPQGVFSEDPPRFAGTVRRCRLHGAYMAAQAAFLRHPLS